MKEGLIDAVMDDFTLKASSVVVAVERFSSVSIMIVLCLINTKGYHHLYACDKAVQKSMVPMQVLLRGENLQQ